MSMDEEIKTRPEPTKMRVLLDKERVESGERGSGQAAHRLKRGLLNVLRIVQTKL